MVNLNVLMESYNLDVLEETNEVRVLFYDYEDAEDEPIVYRVSGDFNPFHYIDFSSIYGGFLFKSFVEDCEDCEDCDYDDYDSPFLDDF